MRGHYQVTSQSDPRWNKLGRDFICPYRGALNFNLQNHIDRTRARLQKDPPADLTYYVYWDGMHGMEAPKDREF